MVIKESGGVRLFPVLEKFFVVWLWKGENILLPKSVQDSRLPRSPSGLQKAKVGLQPKEGKQEVEPVEERR